MKMGTGWSPFFVRLLIKRDMFYHAAREDHFMYVPLTSTG